MTLSHIISNITNQFLPALQYKYVFRNFKQSDLYRSYNPSVVPSYLQGRPKQTILHCLHRQASSNKFVKAVLLIIWENLKSKAIILFILEMNPMIPKCIHVETGVLTISFANTFLPYSNIFQSGIVKNSSISLFEFR